MGKAEQLDVPGTEREVDAQLENAIRQIKSKTEDQTQAKNEVRKAKDRGNTLLHEKELESYTSEKQGFTLVRNDKEDVKIVPWSPPKPPRAKAEA